MYQYLDKTKNYRYTMCVDMKDVYKFFEWLNENHENTGMTSGSYGILLKLDDDGYVWTRRIEGNHKWARKLHKDEFIKRVITQGSFLRFMQITHGLPLDISNIINKI